MQLRPYQEEAIDAFTRSMKVQKRNLIVLPTGSGKTVVFCSIAKKNDLKTLVIAHTREIINQIAKTCKKMGITNVHSATVQSAIRPDRWPKLSMERYQLLIIDECHRSCTKSYTDLIRFLNIPYLLGVTATPFRTDQKKLDTIFGLPIFEIPLIKMIQDGFLCDFEGYRIKTSVNISKIRKQNGDFTCNLLSSVVNVANRNCLIVDSYQKIANGEKTICFCCDIDHAIELKKAFQGRGVAAEAVHGLLSNKARIDIIKKFAMGEIRVLTNCQVLTEGFDEPSVTCLLMGRPTCSKVLYMQMIGRGSRIYPGKDVCKVIEFTDNCFDVCALEALVDAPVNPYKDEKVRLTELFDRREKQLEEGKGTFIEKVTIIPKTIYERSATTWQINKLKERNIKFKFPITEFEANTFLFGVSRGEHSQTGK